ncbi:hypothetical protein ATCC90586_009775 [Pythium insidiosum]|nr:hypothetical protein ATCC90586_009775 [Pythium insidiosum]
MQMEPERRHGRGHLRYSVVAGRTNVTFAFASYPLKFLHPRGSVRLGHDTFVTYMLGYGGGLVGGDAVDMDCSIDADACVVLCTQATTKVFKATASADCVKQQFSFELGPLSTLALLPDPITCFERAKYQQKQVFRLRKDSSLVLVDWLTSGRKRNFLSTGCLQENRTEVHEHWDFEEYDSRLEVSIDGEVVLTDRTRLCDDEPTKLRRRMQGAHVLGVMVVLGPKMKVLTDRVLQLSRRKRLHHASDITPQGRLSSDTDFPGVLASASPLGETGGAITRFIAEDAETAMMFMRSTLASLEDELGFKPFQENR